MIIWDHLQAKEYNGHTYADSLHARQVINLIIRVSGEHAGCYLAMRYGLASALAGHVSTPKLAKATRLPTARCVQILADMRDIITRAAG